VVVRPDVWSAAEATTRRAAVLIVHGRIQRRGAVVHLLATRLETTAASPQTATDGETSPPPGLTRLPRMSRDFC
jgi:hypothetical protein